CRPGRTEPTSLPPGIRAPDTRRPGPHPLDGTDWSRFEVGTDLTRPMGHCYRSLQKPPRAARCPPFAKGAKGGFGAHQIVKCPNVSWFDLAPESRCGSGTERPGASG